MSKETKGVAHYCVQAARGNNLRAQCQRNGWPCVTKVQNTAILSSVAASRLQEEGEWRMGRRTRSLLVSGFSEQFPDGRRAGVTS